MSLLLSHIGLTNDRFFVLLSPLPSQFSLPPLFFPCCAVVLRLCSVSRSADVITTFCSFLSRVICLLLAFTSGQRFYQLFFFSSVSGIVPPPFFFPLLALAPLA